jgi:hypothetical protein
MTVGTLRDSLQEVIKIAVEQEASVEAIHELLDAREGLEVAFLYLTDRSYKCNAR